MRDVFRTRNMRALPGNMGIAHCRYPTAGSSSDSAESQPFYVNSPFGIVLGHNGNLTNTEQLKEEMFRQDLRHINTNSDSEVLLNVLAHEMQATAKGFRLDLDTIFAAVAGVHRRCRGAYAVVVMIAGYGMLAFRDPLRHSAAGHRLPTKRRKATEYLLASESVALDTLGFQVLRDVAPGEAIFIDLQHQMHHRQCAQNPVLAPCIFEYVYLARPDSVIDGVSVYETRLLMGEYLADKVIQKIPGRRDRRGHSDSRFEPPIGDAACTTNRGSVSRRFRQEPLHRPYLHHAGAGHARASVRQKLNTVAQEFKGKRVLLVDDSIVRGTTSREIVEMARAAGALKVYFASAAPPVRFPNVYGIDMPTRSELIATGRSDEEIAREIGADALVYQDLDALKASIRDLKPTLSCFDTSCFDGTYVTGDVTPEYLDAIEQAREGKIAAASEDSGSSEQMHLNLMSH